MARRKNLPRYYIARGHYRDHWLIRDRSRNDAIAEEHSKRETARVCCKSLNDKPQRELTVEELEGDWM